MPATIWAALFAYLMTVLSVLVLIRRSANWRIRLLCAVIGLMLISQCVTLVGQRDLWISRSISRSVAGAVESMQLLIAVLALTAVHLLNKENRDRRATDARLRVVE
ncbi:MAG: hypothetical protein JJE04_13965 [Acidobacteriia bacterium]|nr:hypothetical protein [Terriglobia bacterium]